MDKDPTTDTRAAAGTAMPETVKEPRLPEKVSQLRQKLGQKAKQEPRFRFYSLYGRILEKETLRAAWAQVRAVLGQAKRFCARSARDLRLSVWVSLWPSIFPNDRKWKT